MGAFFAIAVLFTLSWVGAIWLYAKVGDTQKKYEGTLGPSFFIFFIAMFVGQILLVKTMSGVTRPATDPPALTLPEFGGLTPGQVMFIAIISALTIPLFASQIYKLTAYLMRKRGSLPFWADGAATIAMLAYVFLALAKIVWNPAWVGNILIFIILLIGLDFSIRLKKSSFILIFTAIMLLDIYLVWHTGMSKPSAGASPGSGSGSGSGGGWYIAMFQSKMMQHFPFPVGFRWNGHMLGGGDVFFTVLMVTYACRVWSRKAAIWVGTLATLPLLLLPFAYLVLKAPPIAWPYTIFIAPWALVIALFAPKKPEAPKLHIPEKSQ